MKVKKGKYIDIYVAVLDFFDEFLSVGSESLIVAWFISAVTAPVRLITFYYLFFTVGKHKKLKYYLKLS